MIGIGFKKRHPQRHATHHVTQTARTPRAAHPTTPCPMCGYAGALTRVQHETRTETKPKTKPETIAETKPLTRPKTKTKTQPYAPWYMQYALSACRMHASVPVLSMEDAAHLAVTPHARECASALHGRCRTPGRHAACTTIRGAHAGAQALHLMAPSFCSESTGRL
eukprot:365663-Chlamydomonas_euryale.AAC.7